MPFIPHTSDDVATMLKAIGVDSIETLFDEIPPSLRVRALANMGDPLNEMTLLRLLQERAAKDSCLLNFIGAGAYEHHIPAAVWDIASRGEWMTAYTPYQAEASQGTLQLLYEYQTMMAHLMSMDISNASLYDGASATAEAILMAVRCQGKASSRRILLPTTLHPTYRQVVKTLVSVEGIEIIEVPYERKTGVITLETLAPFAGEDIAALVIPQPNFFGLLEDVDALTRWANAHHAFTIAVVNPLAMALLKPPGEWGESGVDIACGEGQPFGVPVASGGPYFGFLCCKKEHVRQLPGRLIGRTLDLEGKSGFTLTLQAREQHIRRAKATSNICTNQGLLVTAGTIYMSLLGARGLYGVAAASHANTRKLKEMLLEIEGVEIKFTGPFFHEMVIVLPVAVDKIIQELALLGIQGGFKLHEFYSELKNCLLVCVTETKTEEDLITFWQALQTVMSNQNKNKEKGIAC